MRPLLALFSILLVLACVPACAQDGWKIYANAPLTFSVEGPGDPKVSTISNFPGPDIQSTTVSYNEGKIERMVRIFEPIDRPWPIELILAEKIRGGTIVSSETIDLAGVKVRQVHYRKVYPDGMKTNAWLRVAVKDGRLYQVSGIELAPGRAGGTERFVRSFRFL